MGCAVRGKDCGPGPLGSNRGRYTANMSSRNKYSKHGLRRSTMRDHRGARGPVEERSRGGRRSGTAKTEHIIWLLCAIPLCRKR